MDWAARRPLPPLAAAHGSASVVCTFATPSAAAATATVAATRRRLAAGCAPLRTERPSSAHPSTLAPSDAERRSLPHRRHSRGIPLRGRLPSDAACRRCTGGGAASDVVPAAVCRAVLGAVVCAACVACSTTVSGAASSAHFSTARGAVRCADCDAVTDAVRGAAWDAACRAFCGAVGCTRDGAVCDAV